MANPQLETFLQQVKGDAAGVELEGHLWLMKIVWS
jgi:hypothetical protein